MKSILSCIMLILSFGTAWSQKTSFGFYGGAVFNTLHVKTDEGKDNSDLMPGPQVGGFVDIPLSNRLSFQPGLAYVLKGGKEKGDGYEAKTFLHEIEIPINMVAKVSAANGKFLFGLGPSLGILLAAKDKFKFDGDGWESEKLHIGNDKDKDNIRRFDLGLNAMIGYEFHQPVFVALHYKLGIGNRIPDTHLETPTLTSNYIGIRVGYFLRRG